MKFNLYTSECVRCDRYFEMLESIATELSLDFVATRITDETEIEKEDFENACMITYCAGCFDDCHVHTADSSEDNLSLPVLMCDDRILISNGIPTPEVLREVLEQV